MNNKRKMKKKNNKVTSPGQHQLSVSSGRFQKASPPFMGNPRHCCQWPKSATWALESSFKNHGLVL
jgi:hypothetical protein